MPVRALFLELMALLVLAPVGPTRLELVYSGCGMDAGKATRPTAEIAIGVEEERVTEVRFNGAQLVTLPPRADSVVTLEEIYEAITGKPTPAP
jgi:hypothetical protein